MKTPPFEPVRFLDQPPQNQQGEVARLIRHAIGAAEKPAPVLKGRIRQTLRRRSATRRRTMRTLLVGGAIFISGGVVGAVVHPILRLPSHPKVEAVESVAPSSPGRRVRSGRPSRPPSASLPVEAMPEPGVEPVVLPAPAPAPTSESKGLPLATASPPVQTLDRSPVPRAIEPSKTEAAPVRAARGKETVEKPTLPVARADQPKRTQAEPHPLQIALREPPRASPPAPPPTTLQPPAFVTPPVPVESAAQAPHRLSAPAAASPVAIAPPAPPSAAPAPPPATEQVLLARAINSLRVQRRPATALAALDEYEARYPKGSMLAEVARLRAEALLLLGQRRAALDELNREPTAGTAHDEESRLVRGELRASAGRWREALADFDVLVSAWLARGPRVATSPKLQERFERALWGRACARGHLGDEAGSRADLQALVIHFPQGRFAVQASRRLGEPQPR